MIFPILITEMALCLPARDEVYLSICGRRAQLHEARAGSTCPPTAYEKLLDASDLQKHLLPVRF